MKWILENWEHIAGILAGLVLIAEVIVNITPSEKDNSILLKIKRVIDLIAPNRYKNPNTGEAGEFKCEGGLIQRIKEKRKDKKQ
jgi:hypothetical protein